MLIIGLTGSLAMGKTTTARIFMEEGIPVHDSDHCVHELYRVEAVEPIRRLDPQLVRTGVVDRVALTEYARKDPLFLGKLESIIHPLVEEKRSDFLKAARLLGAYMVVLDVPLLFETGLQNGVDLILVVTTDAETQRARALQRPGMTIEKLHLLLSRQMPSAEKIKRAHYVLDTSSGLDRLRSSTH
jgi:dephospho-CoA kinase